MDSLLAGAEAGHVARSETRALGLALALSWSLQSAGQAPGSADGRAILAEIEGMLAGPDRRNVAELFRMMRLIMASHETPGDEPRGP